jgi:uncharacterized DUF497 family protein
VSFEWDTKKATANRTKHHVDFADAVAVFEDEMAMTIDQAEFGEARHVTVGSDAFGRILVVAYTWRGDRIRLISARRATRPERRHYEVKR